MAIIFLFCCSLAFCDANLHSKPLSNATALNKTETSTQTNNTPSPITIAPTSPANLDHSSTILPTMGFPTATTATASGFNKLFSVNHLLMVALGLILACTILLISTLLLAWKVCQLSRRLKMLSGHSDLMIPAKYWKDNNKSDADAKETAVLMGDLNHTRDEAGDGGNGPETESEQGAKAEVHENGVEQKEGSAKNEEVKETPAAATEDPSSPKEEGEKSHVDKPETSPASEEKQEDKDGE